MAVRRAPFRFDKVHSSRCAQMLERLAELARAGDIQGIAVGAVFSRSDVRYLLGGVLETDELLSYYVINEFKNAKK